MTTLVQTTAWRALMTHAEAMRLIIKHDTFSQTQLDQNIADRPGREKL